MQRFHVPVLYGLVAFVMAYAMHVHVKLSESVKRQMEFDAESDGKLQKAFELATAHRDHLEGPPTVLRLSVLEKNQDLLRQYLVALERRIPDPAVAAEEKK